MYFMVRMGQIRTEMRREISQLPLPQLTRFEFTPHEFRKAKVDDHEVKVEGRMYDIARIEFFNHRVVVFAKHDAAEDNLLWFFNEVFARSWNDDQTSPTSLTHFISLTFIVESCTMLKIELQKDIHHTVMRESYYSIDCSLESPPPKS